MSLKPSNNLHHDRKRNVLISADEPPSSDNTREAELFPARGYQGCNASLLFLFFFYGGSLCSSLSVPLSRRGSDRTHAGPQQHSQIVHRDDGASSESRGHPPLDADRITESLLPNCMRLLRTHITTHMQSGSLKGQFTPKLREHISPPSCCVYDLRNLFFMRLSYFWRFQRYHGHVSRLYFVCGVQSAREVHLNHSTSLSCCLNPNPVAQDFVLL